MGKRNNTSAATRRARNAIKRRSRQTSPGGRDEARIQVPTNMLLDVLLGSNHEQLLYMGLPAWFVKLAEGKSARQCLDATLTIQSAFRTLGVEAVPAPV